MTFISDIDPNQPAFNDDVGDGDDQIRQLKSDVKDSFPNISGAVTVDQDRLNDTVRADGSVDFTGSVTLDNSSASSIFVEVKNNEGSGRLFTNTGQLALKSNNSAGSNEENVLVATNGGNTTIYQDGTASVTFSSEGISVAGDIIATKSGGAAYIEQEVSTDHDVGFRAKNSLNDVGLSLFVDNTTQDLVFNYTEADATSIANVLRFDSSVPQLELYDDRFRITTNGIECEEIEVTGGITTSGNIEIHPSSSTSSRGFLARQNEGGARFYTDGGDARIATTDSAGNNAINAIVANRGGGLELKYPNDGVTKASIDSNGLNGNGNRITNVADPTSDQNVATKKYVDDGVSSGISSAFSRDVLFSGNLTGTNSGTLSPAYTNYSLIMVEFNWAGGGYKTWFTIHAEEISNGEDLAFSMPDDNGDPERCVFQFTNSTTIQRLAGNSNGTITKVIGIG